MLPFISRKSNRFDFSLGELINLIFWFRVDEKWFSTLGDSCHGTNGNSILAVTITTNQKKQICRLVLCFILLWWGTSRNLRANSTSRFWDKMLQLPIFQLYVLIISRTRFRVNPQSIVAWMSRNSCSKQARNLKFKWLQLNSNPQPLSS